MKFCRRPYGPRVFGPAIRGWMRVGSAALLVLLQASSASPASPQDYFLGPDDVLKITVYREEELDREVRVGTDGRVSMPLIGVVPVEGLSVSGLEADIAHRLRRYLRNPQVTVFIKEYATVSVTGQVNEPGSFPLKGEMGVLEVIGLAKGFTKMASQNNVKVMRMEGGEKKTIVVRVADISKRGDKSEDVLLRRGDIVFVPESLF